MPNGRVARRAASRKRAARRARGVALGVSFVLAGGAFLGVVAWQQWGTGVMTARAQTALKAEFHRSLRHPDKHRDRAVPGGADGLILIPALHVDAAFVEGIAEEDLAKGPGHYPDTPMPGRGGNVAIAGHRTTHGAPFWSLDSLHEGDDITLITRKGRFVYRVRWVKVASPFADWVVGPTAQPSLTLTTCWPRFSASHRFVVRAVQVFGRTPFGFIDHRASSLQAWARPPARTLGRSLR